MSSCLTSSNACQIDASDGRFFRLDPIMFSITKYISAGRPCGWSFYAAPMLLSGLGSHVKPLKVDINVAATSINTKRELIICGYAPNDEGLVLVNMDQKGDERYFWSDLASPGIKARGEAVYAYLPLDNTFMIVDWENLCLKSISGEEAYAVKKHDSSDASGRNIRTPCIGLSYTIIQDSDSLILELKDRKGVTVEVTVPGVLDDKNPAQYLLHGSMAWYNHIAASFSVEGFRESYCFILYMQLEWSPKVHGFFPDESRNRAKHAFLTLKSHMPREVAFEIIKLAIE